MHKERVLIREQKCVSMLIEMERDVTRIIILMKQIALSLSLSPSLSVSLFLSPSLLGISAEPLSHGRQTEIAKIQRYPKDLR